jgi:tRNA pseudouridine55 synthase
MDGFLLIDKPSGPSSFDVVRAVRRAARVRKVGHTGTLDPLASGLLVVGLGRGTKLINYLQDGEKRYRGVVQLGAETDTDDAHGRVTEEAPIPPLAREAVEEALSGFVGRIEQRAPRYSALKDGGEPQYRKARRGEEVVPKVREITVHEIELVALTESTLEIDVRCGKGTYIRSLARDISRRLGTRGHLRSLRRLETSGFLVDQAIGLEKLTEAAEKGELVQHLIRPAAALRAMPSVTLSPAEAEDVRHGRSVRVASDRAEIPPSADYVALSDASGDLLAVARRDGRDLKPVRVLSG